MARSVRSSEARKREAQSSNGQSSNGQSSKAQSSKGQSSKAQNRDEEQDQRDRTWMREALRLAALAERIGEVPVGAVVVRDGRPIGRGYNRREVEGDPLAHAELRALSQAARTVGGWRLFDCTLYVTLEPCAMCAGALVNSRMGRLVYGAADPKAGFCGSLGDLTGDARLNHRLPVCAGVLEEECSELLRRFFRRLRTRRVRG